MNTLPLVDLSELREITEGNPEIEAELFDEFCLSVGQVLLQMQKALKEHNTIAWTASAHTIKGAARNLGANHLGDVCDKAQQEREVSNYPALLKEIAQAFLQVELFLQAEKKKVGVRF